MTTETAPVENVEQAAPAQEVQAEEKAEVVANGDHKAENGNCENVAEAPANGEAPNAASTPIKSKAKRRAIVANVRAAFQRLGLMSQLRALGRRMRRNPKQKQEPTVEQAAQNGETEKAQENGNGLLDGAALLASTTPAADEQTKCNGNGHAVHDEAAAPECNGNASEEQTSAPVVESQNNNEITEQTAVVAQ